MGIWSKCIKKREKKVRISLFDQLECNYSYEAVYLGAQAKVSFDDGMDYYMHFSNRDGMDVKIKQNQPYQVLFEYADGPCHYIKDTDHDYAGLLEKIQQIRKDEERKVTGVEMYEILEQVIYEFIVGEH